MSLDNYFVRMVMMFVGSASMFMAIAGGYYTAYQLVTFLGN
jgi:hypothetical protein